MGRPLIRRRPRIGSTCRARSSHHQPGAWACQRGVRFRDGGRDWLALFTDHPGLKKLEPVMLFELDSDPYEQTDLAAAQPGLVDKARGLLDGWKAEMARSTGSTDPLLTVIEEGGPFHCKGELAGYVERLRSTGRVHHAKRIAAFIA
jgi:choline-sulfatase